MRNSECGMAVEGRSPSDPQPAIPHSPFRIPHSVRGGGEAGPRRLALHPSRLALVVLGAWVAPGSPWVWVPEVVLFLVAVWLLVFFRDPSRSGPRGEQYVIAPADGKIVDVQVVDEPMYLK